MSSLPTGSGFSTKTIVQALRERTFACAHPGCDRRELAPVEARVPDLLNLYLKATGGEVNPKYPLSASDLASDVRCLVHSLEGIRMRPILDTADLMDRWIARNARELEAKSCPQPKPQQQEQRPSGGYVVGLLATRQPVVDKPAPQYRHRTKVPKVKRPPNAPKNYGEPHQKAPENPSKAGKGQNPRKHKKKQQGH